MRTIDRYRPWQSFPMRALKIFSLVVFIGLSALAAATLLVTRDPASAANVLQRVPVDVVWLALLPASILAMISFEIPLTTGRVFLAAAIPVALFLLFYTLGYVDFYTITSSDSELYLERVLKGTYSSSRNSGYPTILLAVQNTIGLDRLAWLQLGADIACYMVAAFLLAARFAGRWIALVLALAILLQGVMSQWAPHILTEALFIAGFGLFAAALGALARRPDWPAVIVASIGIIMATLAKSHGVVLVVPALLLMRFLPKGRRLAVSGVIVACGLAAYGLMAINSYVRTGTPAAENFAGFSLMGHVAWMMDDTSMPPSDLTRSLISAVAPVIQQRPADLADIHSPATLDRYVDRTLQDFNVVFWGKLYPIAIAQLGTRERVNSFFLRFALSSIRAHPLAYLRHVAAHFYGMWRDLGRSPPLREATVDIRRYPSYPDQPLNGNLRNEVGLTPYPGETTINGQISSQTNLPLMFGKAWDGLIPASWTIWLGLLAFLLSVLVLIPGPLAHVYRTEIMLALCLNAYYAAHVLLQVSQPRYAAMGIMPAIFLAVSFVFTSFYAIKSAVAARDGFGWASNA